MLFIPTTSLSTRGMCNLVTRSRFISTVGVIGAGQMGGGIAQVAAVNAGKNVVLVDSSKEQLARAVSLMDKLLQKAVQREKMSEEQRVEALDRVQTCSDMAILEQVDFVVEAATENTDLKLKIFEQISQCAPAHAILGSNTSSISITKIAAATDRPEQVIGMHFMNPVPVMKLVEIIPGLATSDSTLAATTALATEMGKVTTVSRDVPGFIANRILMPYINEAVQALFEGIGTVEDIDTTMKLGTNVPMGPLTLADFIGLDTCLAIMQVLHTELGDSKYRPSPLLVQYVNAGWHGKKNGRGFYEY